MSETVEELETDEDDEYLKMLTLIGRTEAIDTRVAIHEICHYLIDQFNVTDRIVQVSITPNDKWEGVCVGKRPKAFTKAIDASDVRAIVPMMPLAGRGSQLDRRCGAIRARYRYRTHGGRSWRTARARRRQPRAR